MPASFTPRRLSDIPFASANVSGARGAVCFTYDDIFSSHDTARSEMTKRGLRGTFACYSDAIDVSGRMTSAQLLTAYNQGHEIACHSKTHANYVTGLSAAQRASESSTSKAAIEAIIGSGNCTTFVYPYGDSTARNTTTDSELYLRFDRIAATQAARKVFFRGEQHVNLIGRRNWTDTPTTGTDISQAGVLDMIRLASQTPTVVAFYTHDIGASGSATLANLTEAFDLCVSLGVPCLTLAEAFPAMRYPIDGGFEDSTLAHWKKTDSPSGQQIAESIVDTPAAGLPGSRSLHLQCGSDSGSVYVSSQPIPVKPSTAYTISFRYRVAFTSGSGSFRVRASEGSYQSTSPANTTGGSLTATSWTQSSYAFTTSATTTFLSVDFVLDQKTGEAWVDHVHVGPTSEGALG